MNGNGREVNLLLTMLYVGLKISSGGGYFAPELAVRLKNVTHSVQKATGAMCDLQHCHHCVTALAR